MVHLRIAVNHMPLKHRSPVKIGNWIWDIYLGVLNLEALKPFSCIVKWCNKIYNGMGYTYLTIYSTYLLWHSLDGCNHLKGKIVKINIMMTNYCSSLAALPWNSQFWGCLNFGKLILLSVQKKCHSKSA